MIQWIDVCIKLETSEQFSEDCYRRVKDLTIGVQPKACLEEDCIAQVAEDAHS